MRVRFTPEALQAARTKRTWWEQHRDKAPRLFVVELAAVVAKLRDGSDEDRQRYALRGGNIIWRLLMPKTRNHVYYRCDLTAGVVEIVVIWNATASAPPDLISPHILAEAAVGLIHSRGPGPGADAGPPACSSPRDRSRRDTGPLVPDEPGGTGPRRVRW